MIAALTMYARPELAGAHDRYWELIRAALGRSGVSAPARLSQDREEFEVWNDPGLIMSQTCGMPFRLWLHEHTSLVGTPDYGLDGCPPGYYRSALVVRRDDERPDPAAFRDSLFAYNQTFSQSGYAAPYAHLMSLGVWFEQRLHTQQHVESARAVAVGRADIAALDAVSWRLTQAYERFAGELRVLEWTAPTPGLPYITADPARVETIFDAVTVAIAGLSDIDQEALGIKGIVKISKHDYLSVPNPPDP